jgi:ATP-dependent exoDNAse (exonuclease V) beta subunit
MLSAEELVVAGNRFRDWVIATYPDARWHTEIEVSGPKSSGGHWHGIVDLLLELPDGSVVIIDHKSAPIRREYCEAKAATFISQLDAYREILEGTGRTVAATCVHFPLGGVVVNCK